MQKEQTTQLLNKQIKHRETHWQHLQQSFGRMLAQRLQRWRTTLIPPHSVRDQCLEDIVEAWRTRKLQPLIEARDRFNQDISRRAKVFSWKMQLRFTPPRRDQLIQVDEVQARTPVRPHQTNVEIIICVHNALADLERCLESVVHCTNLPYKLILIDDGSDLPTQNYLSEFAQKHSSILLRNEEARGYTLAANQGLRYTSAEYVVLLNSDTVVTSGWLDRLIACAESDSSIGLVGPLSNAASWQSIPEIECEGDWATNQLPPGLTIEEMGQRVAQNSARLYPPMPFLNGFCLLIRRQTLQEVGYFDEENFKAGYGEENDYALRARKANWTLALADDTYIYHTQSRSYSHERRRRLSEQAALVLAKKHGQRLISQGVAICRHDRVLMGIRARSQAMLARHEWVEQGQSKFEGRRVLFVLPLSIATGGGNVVIDEAIAMRKMGVDAQIFNLACHQDGFQRAYPELKIPVRYGEKGHLTTLAQEYDAIIATFHASVNWLAPLSDQPGRPILGYYVQDFEPYLYPTRSEGFQMAWNSYTLLPDMVRFTKTEWTRQEVKAQTGAECAVVGVSLNIDLFRPRPRLGPEWPNRPLRIMAMVRATTPYRAPQLTMEILRQAARRYRGSIDIVIFGTSLDDVNFADLPRNFTWRLAGVLNQKQVAHLLNEADIFVDFSTHQAMGLTALEAMACGAAVIVPERGGATSFARHEENSLVINTSSLETCWQALRRLIEDHSLRMRLQQRALVDVCNFFPEQPAFNILNALFASADSRIP